MNWVDLLVLAIAAFAAVSGARQGMVVAVPAFIGVLVGLLLGTQLAPVVVSRFDNVVTKVVFAVGVVVLLVALGETLGVYIGRAVKSKVNATPLRGVDNALGAVVQGAVVFVVAWMIALPLTSVAGLPTLAKGLNQSAILSTVDGAMPQAARDLSEDLQNLFDVSGFPAAMDPFNRTPLREVSPPDPELSGDPVVQRLRPSVLKVRGRAPSCSRALEGTGFVIAPERVMTNAHVVAGTTEVSIEVGQGKFDATVVHYDAQTDLAILAVPNLDAQPLQFRTDEIDQGEDGIVLGYPLDGPYTASEARVRERIPMLRGPDIYDAQTVTRDVYTIRAKVRSGNSGGPLVDREGRVMGVVFGAAVDDQETGFVLTPQEVADEVAKAPGLVRRAPTQTCAS
ncbi:MarP family serine protease [Actinosynnema pretiosum subsp. pretiosum]|uniref:Colicin V production protein n=2 Tax=Actinosynnema TaxID=40566 RepID=C6WF95_ACTMD|nr:MarP family serine protease [Actinosynnema mirum]ACU34227.1 Colicin V production protein [Actinosynnema mirum DSM 43827]AXX27598.1 putative serine protease [Actinosynnema pretiosum subsp. pretiosum]QUF01693.1 MarP family serine protease [Actinosynnema pretiosum subsp. pretiosum]